MRAVVIGIGVAAALSLGLTLSGVELAGFAASAAVAGGFALFCGLRRRHATLAWAACLLPALPLAAIHLQWWLVTTTAARRSSLGAIDGVLGFANAAALLCLAAWAACLSASFGDGDRRAARVVAFGLPPAWAAFAALAVWDPFGALGYLIR